MQMTLGMLPYKRTDAVRSPEIVLKIIVTLEIAINAM